MPSPKIKKLLATGDILKTQPLAGYWVCSVVLAQQAKTNQFAELCLIGCTRDVFQRDFSISEIDPSRLELGSYPNRFGTQVPSIFIHAARIKPGVEIIGQMDVSGLFPRPLRFDVGNGESDRWPLCGPVSPTLGGASVWEWRSIHDREQWLKDVEAVRRDKPRILALLKGK